MVGLQFSKLIATVRFCYPAPVFAVLAQSVEHLPCKQDVVSSIPTDSTKHGSLAHLVERQLCKLDVIGSNPIGSTKIAVVAELVDASVLEADVLWRESSSLSDRTIKSPLNKKRWQINHRKV